MPVSTWSYQAQGTGIRHLGPTAQDFRAAFGLGENGTTIFFQNELPYDPPNQAAWQHDGVLGWAAYKVAPWVRTHQLWGAGSYIPEVLSTSSPSMATFYQGVLNSPYVDWLTEYNTPAQPTGTNQAIGHGSFSPELVRGVITSLSRHTPIEAPKTRRRFPIN